MPVREGLVDVSKSRSDDESHCLDVAIECGTEEGSETPFCRGFAHVGLCFSDQKSNDAKMTLLTCDVKGSAPVVHRFVHFSLCFSDQKANEIDAAFLACDEQGSASL